MSDRPAERPRSGERDGTAERSLSDDRFGSEGQSRPARQTEAARSRRRTSWHGHGERTATEKDAVGAFLDDVAYAFADVSFLSAPALSAVLLSTPEQWFGVEGATLVAWTAMVVGAALIRGGWVTPLATDARGWVAITPWLVALRLVYYNAALASAALGGSAAEAALSPAAATGGPPEFDATAVAASALVALLVGALAVGLFPRVADSFYAVVEQ